MERGDIVYKIFRIDLDSPDRERTSLSARGFLRKTYHPREGAIETGTAMFFTVDRAEVDSYIGRDNFEVWEVELRGLPYHPKHNRVLVFAVQGLPAEDEAPARWAHELRTYRIGPTAGEIYASWKTGDLAKRLLDSVTPLSQRMADHLFFSLDPQVNCLCDEFQYVRNIDNDK